MSFSARRAIGVLVAAVGIVLAVAGALMVAKLGPAGEARFSATSHSPGALVVPSDVLNSVDVPVRVTATRSDGGPVRLASAASVDARSVLATSAVSTVSGVRFPSGTLALHTSGAGPLSDVSTADIWRLAETGAGSAELVVDQGRGPEIAVVTSGDAQPLSSVTMTVTWADRLWFFEALGLAMIGAVIAAFALNFLWQTRDDPARHEVSTARTSVVRG